MEELMTPDKLVEEVLQNEELWDTDLTKLPGFLQAVQEQLQELMTHGVLHNYCTA